jgi:hypothetical protein
VRLNVECLGVSRCSEWNGRIVADFTMNGIRTRVCAIAYMSCFCPLLLDVAKVAGKR